VGSCDTFTYWRSFVAGYILGVEFDHVGELVDAVDQLDVLLA
jgi:hypothetical protein